MKAPFKRILVALDRSVTAPLVFELAIALAEQNQSCIMVTHSVSLKTLEELGQLIDSGVGLASSQKIKQLQDEYIEEKKEVWHWLEEYARKAQSQGIETEIKCETGEASERICSLARRWDADLIILGRNEKRTLMQKLFGSTSNKVLRKAPCSVMVMQFQSNTKNLLSSGVSKHWQQESGNSKQELNQVSRVQQLISQENPQNFL